DASPKWCQNALGGVGRSLRYSVALARQLGLARLLNASHDILLKSAFRMAGKAIAREGRTQATGGEPPISMLTVDVDRYLTLFAVGLNPVRRDPPRGRGRPPARGQHRGVRAAAAHGLDLGALRAGLRLTPAERLEALDASQRLVERLRSGRRIR